MKKYYQIENYGHGFITHEDMEITHIAGYPGDIWVTTNTQWAQRVGAIELTKEQAQDIVNAAIAATWIPPNSTEPPQIVLP
jgi:glucan biosynthesis protein